MEFKKVDFDDLRMNPHTLFSKDWMVLTAGDREKYNPMTVSWGQMGSLWFGENAKGFNGLPVVTVYVRPSRFTKPIIDERPFFTLSVLDEKYRKELAFLGTESGRDYPDKLAACGLSPEFIDESVAVAQAKMIFVCRKIYVGPIEERGFVDKSMISDNYPKKDFHDYYIGEIVGTYLSLKKQEPSE